MLQAIRGMNDILPEETPVWQVVETTFKSLMRRYGYQEIRFPIVENTDLFKRTIGVQTDIVEKEMYTFLDKGKNSITLRPEFTAGVMRLYLQNGMHVLPKPVKLFSMGPIFRYERPQAGRFRQHTQFNVEALGELDPAIDLEVMSIAWQLYAELGFKGLTFQLNSTGCSKCRPKYIETLKAYYKNHIDVICDDCKRRLDCNALRLLDCKKDSCQPVIAKAPVISEHLCDECQDHFQILQSYLDLMGRPYTINHKLVRGLDYVPLDMVKEIFIPAVAHRLVMQDSTRSAAEFLLEVLESVPVEGKR